MGPNGLANAVPRGGHVLDEYPINWSNHLEGHIERHWLSHKATTCTITDAGEISRFVHFLVTRLM